MAREYHTLTVPPAEPPVYETTPGDPNAVPPVAPTWTETTPGVPPPLSAEGDVIRAPGGITGTAQSEKPDELMYSMNGYTQKGVTLARNGGDADTAGEDVAAGSFGAYARLGSLVYPSSTGKCVVSNVYPGTGGTGPDGGTIFTEPVGFLRQSVNLGSRDMLANVVTMGQVKWGAIDGAIRAAIWTDPQGPAILPAPFNGHVVIGGDGIPTAYSF